jgi:hypothetical protein
MRLASLISEVMPVCGFLAAAESESPPDETALLESVSLTSGGLSVWELRVERGYGSSSDEDSSSSFVSLISGVIPV